MQQLLILIHVIAAISIIGLVLLQHGKGADAGASFGSGASNTMFGSTGTLPVLLKLTAVLAAIFFATSIGITYLVHRAQRAQTSSVFDTGTGTTGTTEPAPSTTPEPSRTTPEPSQTTPAPQSGTVPTPPPDDTSSKTTNKTTGRTDADTAPSSK